MFGKNIFLYNNMFYFKYQRVSIGKYYLKYFWKNQESHLITPQSETQLILFFPKYKTQTINFFYHTVQLFIKMQVTNVQLFNKKQVTNAFQP